jgi:hypothetical protein
MVCTVGRSVAQRASDLSLAERPSHEALRHCNLTSIVTLAIILSLFRSPAGSVDRQANNRRLKVDAVEIRVRTKRHVGGTDLTRNGTPSACRRAGYAAGRPNPRGTTPTLADAGIDKQGHGGRLPTRSGSTCEVWVRVRTSGTNIYSLIPAWRALPVATSHAATCSIARHDCGGPGRALSAPVVNPPFHSVRSRVFGSLACVSYSGLVVHRRSRWHSGWLHADNRVH